MNTTRRHRLFTLAWFGLLAALLIVFVLVWLFSPPVHPPVPTPVPTTVVVYGPDTGWHVATDRYETLYCVSSTYSDADQSSREAMNRFAHQFPEGDVNGPPCGGNS